MVIIRHTKLLLILLIPLISIYSKTFAQSFFSELEMFNLNTYYIPLYETDSVKTINKEKINIFFLNGECSICLVKMKKANDYFKNQQNLNEQTIFITETSDTILFNFYRDKFKIDFPVLWDKNKRIDKKGVTSLSSTVFLLNRKGEILFEGDIFANEKKRLKYERIVRRL